MAISFVGSTSAVSDSVTAPSFLAGDLLLFFGYSTSGTPPPAVSGLTTLYSVGASGASHRIMYVFAGPSTVITPGVWTGTSANAVLVHRGVGGFGSTSVSTGNSNVLSYPALTIADSTSWVVRLASSVATDLTTATPAGYTGRTLVTTGVRGLDSNGGLSSNPNAATQAVNFFGPWRTHSIELLAAPGLSSDTTQLFKFF